MTNIKPKLRTPATKPITIMSSKEKAELLKLKNKEATEIQAKQVALNAKYPPKLLKTDAPKGSIFQNAVAEKTLDTDGATIHKFADDMKRYVSFSNINLKTGKKTTEIYMETKDETGEWIQQDAFKLFTQAGQLDGKGNWLAKGKAVETHKTLAPVTATLSDDVPSADSAEERLGQTINITVNNNGKIATSKPSTEFEALWETK